MKKLLILSLIMLFISSCNDNDDASNYPNTPDPIFIDINNNGQYDFETDYLASATYDSPSSAQRITGRLKPLNGNQLLLSPGSGVLFLETNDTIKKQNNINSQWIEDNGSLISLKGQFSVFESTWNILSGLDPDQNPGYYLGVKLSSEPEKIGYISLEFSTESGEISILDHQLTDADEIVINN